jgi:hypothetical protein
MKLTEFLWKLHNCPPPQTNQPTYNSQPCTAPPFTLPRNVPCLEHRFALFICVDLRWSRNATRDKKLFWNRIIDRCLTALHSVMNDTVSVAQHTTLLLQWHFTCSLHEVCERLMGYPSLFTRYNSKTISQIRIKFGTLKLVRKIYCALD